MKKNLLKSMALILMLCVSAMASAIDWNGIDFLGDGAGGGAYSNKYKLAVAEGMSVVNIQKPGWAAEDGIYCTFPAGVSECSVAGAIDGAGMCLYLSSFTAQETEVTVKHGLGTSVFYVYYADGTTGGSNTPEVESYTIIFNDIEGTTGSDSSTKETTVDGIVESGAEYISAVSAENIYRAREGYGIKFGSSKAIGSLTLTLKESVTPDSIVLTACSYSTSEGAIVFMGDMNIDATNGGNDNKVIANYIKEYDGATSVSEITIATSSKRAYAVAVTVYPHKDNTTPTPDPTVNLALNKPVVAGYSATPAAEAVDGNKGSRWGSSGGKHWSAENPDQGDDWLYVDLGQVYNIGNIRILFETAAPTDYDLLVSDDAQEWKVIGTYTGQPKTGNGEDDYNVYNFTKDNVSGRYVKIFARDGYANLQWGISIYEFEVYEAVADNEKPVLNGAAIATIAWNQVTVTLNATDNVGVTNCLVTDNANNINGEYPVKEGVLTISGLSAATEYNFTIVALDDAGNQSDNSVNLSATTPAHNTEPTEAAPAPEHDANLVLSIYSDTYQSIGYHFEDWGGGYAETQKNIDGNNYNFYKANTNGGYFGMVLNATANAATMLYWHFDIWAEDDMTVDIYPIYGGTEYYKTVTLKGQQWNSVDLTLSDDYPASITWANVYQIKFAGTAGKTLAVDNIYFYRDPIEDTEIPTDVTATLKSASYFSVTLTCSAQDNSGVVSFDVFDGDTKLASSAGVSGTEVDIFVSGLNAGTAYQLSVVAYDANENKAQPVTVAATTLALPAPAPTPTAEADNVLSLYSDAYTFAPASLDSYNEGWWQNPTLDRVELAQGDEALLYSGQMTGVIGWEFAPIDATDYVMFHIDIYPMAETTLAIGPTYGGNGLNTNVYKETVSLKAGQWNSIDINLSEKELGSIFQFQLADYVAAGALFVDNVYFYKSEITAIDNVTVTDDVQKRIVNGRLVIIRNGVQYNALGQIIK
ncbi:MAG: discoidin domain-containing protein [Paludibacter sp.]|nr:discoidin domain-containing protein [Bacteroidales bacterium]MCM1069144.1 discoidin domain-containing protein [Prevotella sp.]MCM1353583.1 discoidin domain-containing protein [Bacteroides sp.]MCM1442744.1 discoidin domain-containing protein [Muribaculum sp.]MCM1481620.1 discoidin domain-containing protein [Paludibacter sp.]